MMCEPCCFPCCPMPQEYCPMPQERDPCSPRTPSCNPCPSIATSCNPCKPMTPQCNPCPVMCQTSDPCDPCPQYCPPCYIPVKRCKSFELRGSILMTQCECVKRNGLQLDCPKKECQGRPCCSTKPFPICCPSKFHWRLANKTMGMQSSPKNVKCKSSAKGSGCNPCAVECYPC